MSLKNRNRHCILLPLWKNAKWSHIIWLFTVKLHFVSICNTFDCKFWAQKWSKNLSLTKLLNPNASICTEDKKCKNQALSQTKMLNPFYLHQYCKKLNYNFNFQFIYASHSSSIAFWSKQMAIWLCLNSTIEWHLKM